MLKAAVFGEIKNGESAVSTNYLEHLIKSNVAPKTIANEPYHQTADIFDLLVVCGGGDIDPHLYGQEPIEGAKYDRAFDTKEAKYILEFIKRQKPILGICRGMQSINVALGGTLNQDIPSLLGFTHSKETDHEIKISKHSRLYKTMGMRAFVNSRHHQCIKKVGKGLYTAAIAHDGVIEAIESNCYPILGVQWHPERMNGNALFDHFIKEYIKVGQ